MKQMYYTSCVEGRSVSGRGGFQIRAASATLKSDFRRMLLPHIGYRLPAGFDEDTLPEQAPFRLALLNVGESRVLISSVHSGRDPTTNRSGNFFSHTITDLAPRVEAKHAASLFQADFWVSCDHEGPTEIPELGELPASPSAAQFRLKEFAIEHADTIKFILRGLLSLPNDQRLFIVAPPEVIAKAAMVVNDLLPPGMRSSLTFSTYEREPLSSPARIVGSYWRDPSLDLEPVCYNSAGLALNTLSGRYSQTPEMSPFANFAVSCFEQGRVDDLNAFYDRSSEFSLLNVDSIELAYRLGSTTELLSRDDFIAAMGFPDTMRRVCSREGVVDQAVKWAVEDPHFREQHFANCRRYFSDSQLINAIAQQAAAELQRGDLTAAQVAMEDLPPLVSQNDPGQAFAEEISQLLNGVQLPQTAVDYVIPRILQWSSAPKIRDQWLATSPAKLKAFLELPISEEDKLRACELVLKRSLEKPNATALSAIAICLPRVCELLERRGKEAIWHKTCCGLLKSAVPASVTAKDDAGLFARGVNMVRSIAGSQFAPAATTTFMGRIHHLYDKERLSGSLFEIALGSLFQLPEFSASAFLASTVNHWITDTQQGDAYKLLGTRLLNAATMAFKNEATRRFMLEFARSSAAQQLSTETRNKIEDLKTLAEFVERPTLSAVGLACILRGLRHFSDTAEQKACHTWLIQIISQELLKCSTPEASLQLTLEYLTAPANETNGSQATLAGLPRSRVSPGDEWVQSFCAITCELIRHRSLLDNSELILAVAAIGFGGRVNGSRSLNTLRNKATRKELIRYTNSFVEHIASEIGKPESESLNQKIKHAWRGDYESAFGRWVKAFQPRPQLSWFDYSLMAVVGFTLAYFVVYFLTPNEMAKEEKISPAKTNESPKHSSDPELTPKPENDLNPQPSSNLPQ